MSKEMIWPSMMMFASTLGVCGAIGAIAVGADKQEDGKINPFFYTAFANSSIYMVGNGYRLWQLSQCCGETPVLPIQTPSIESNNSDLNSVKIESPRTSDQSTQTYVEREMQRRDSRVSLSVPADHMI